MTVSERELLAIARKPWSTSKKWRMTIIVLNAVMIVFFTGLAVMALHPAVAPQVVDLAKLVLAALALVSAGYCGAQAHSDSSTAKALSNKANTPNS